MLNKHVPLFAPDAPDGGATPPPVVSLTPPAPVLEKTGEKQAESMPGLRAFAKDHFRSTEDTETERREEADKKVDKTKDKAPDKKADDKPPVKPKPVAKAKPAAPVPEPITADKIAEAAARGVASAMAAKSVDKKADIPDPMATLPADEKERVEILQTMEKMFPDRYKGQSGKYVAAYVKAAAALEAYASKWEQEHPGEKFDDAAPEHEEFMEKNAVDTPWEDSHFHRAAARMEAEKVAQEQSKPLTAELAELKRQERLREAGQQIAAAQVESARVLWQGFGDDFAALITPEGNVDSAKFAELQKADPDGFAIRLQAAHNLKFETAELHKLMNNLQPVVEAPPAANDPQFQVKMDQFNCHTALATFCSAQEQRLSTAAPEDKLNEKGQSFLPSAQYYALPKGQREQHWTLSENDLIALRAAELAASAQQTIEKEEARLLQIAKNRGWTIPEKVADNHRTQTAPSTGHVPITALDRDVKPESPSSPTESRLAAAKDKAQNDAGSPMSYWMRRQLGIAS